MATGRMLVHLYRSCTHSTSMKSGQLEQGSWRRHDAMRRRKSEGAMKYAVRWKVVVRWNYYVKTRNAVVLPGDVARSR